MRPQRRHWWLLFFLLSASLISALRPPAPLAAPATELHGYTGISDFKMLNRRFLGRCHDPNPYLAINISTSSPLPDEGNITVTVSGVLLPEKSDWIAMISPANVDVADCPLNTVMYKQTGDLSDLPLLCHYPVKAQYLNNDPSYLSCELQECEIYGEDNECKVKTCSGSVSFHFVNIRTDLEFVFFAGGFDAPCILKRSQPIGFANPAAPLFGHLSGINSTGTSMRLTWVSGDSSPQHVQYADGQSTDSEVSTFRQDDMCSELSPAKDFGWHDPGYIHTAIMTGLQPSTSYFYKYGSDSVGWSKDINFRTPPAAGANETIFLAFGDMGKAPLDQSVEHYIQPGSRSVAEAMADEVAAGNIDSILHIGDISYATGFLVEWDFFLSLITPVAGQVSYMTAIGNHERDYKDSGSVYETPDSGGECGVAYESYFKMPTSAKDKPWYSFEQASAHITVISTENDWNETSEQYQWMKNDLSSVNRTRTPWLIFTGHRPMYSSNDGIPPSVDHTFVDTVEPLLIQNKVDLVLFGHVHNYERTCAIYQNECKAMPAKDKDGLDFYNNSNYTAPVHVIIGMAGFTLDGFAKQVDDWSLVRISEFGYTKVHATKENLSVQLISSKTKEVLDKFYITKGELQS
ncbi:putative inactive purple acid phosphatase 24 [Apostasia shenzhenica]|uniref:Purple acid phosphatase n=1 Tax=Apostasia shenzhenica TaxID=1088818 RepID=A0A2I0ALE8_9ASPA|nr:putative inactive purple acid phosphatase 24 [Apostasia shenzhenica]